LPLLNHIIKRLNLSNSRYILDLLFTNPVSQAAHLTDPESNLHETHPGGQG